MCSTVGVLSTVGGYHQYHGAISCVPWGVFSTVGDIMINVGDILSTTGVFSTVGDIMSTVGVILSIVGDIMMHVGGYHDARGGIS